MYRYFHWVYTNGPWGKVGMYTLFEWLLVENIYLSVYAPLLLYSKNNIPDNLGPLLP